MTIRKALCHLHSMWILWNPRWVRSFFLTLAAIGCIILTQSERQDREVSPVLEIAKEVTDFLIKYLCA